MKIILKIEASKKTCDNCRFLLIFRTGLAGEFHPKCEIFDKLGGWGKENMARDKRCLAAEVPDE